MRVHLHGAADEALREALAARGLELDGGVDAEGLVTVAPPVELAPVAELEPGAWSAVFAAWAADPFFAAQRWLAGALERGSGSWVAVTSNVATQPFPGAAAAGAAALALQTLVRVAAIEGGPHGVRANAVAAGWRPETVPPELDAELAASDTPTRRLATAGDVAAAVSWLLSADAAHVTGEVLRVDGGYTVTRGSRPDPRKE